jgi:hypothetical protein
MLTCYKGYHWRGTFDLEFDHHPTPQELLFYAGQNCCICRVLFEKWKKVRSAEIQTNIDADPERHRCFLRAGLKFDREWGVYLLGFKLRDNENIGNFALKQLKDKENVRDMFLRQAGEPASIHVSVICSDFSAGKDPLTAPPDVAISDHTSSDEVFRLAKSWIDRCEISHDCRNNGSEDPWYPTRLIDMESVSNPKTCEGLVRLVETKNEPRLQGALKVRYVTLSHCWGGANFIRLTNETVPRFERGISVEELPQTFQDAIRFSRRLGIRYIWIDSLCIKQDDTQDWLYESGQMDQVYNNSYCNISATASTNSYGGLFFEREPQQLWVDEIELRTAGVPGLIDVQPFERCVILDLSFWEQNVDNAPVNIRSWVLQERLLAPRVLHFCKDQIAFECLKLDAAECRPEGLPLFQLKAGDFKDGGRLKGIEPSYDGKRLRKARVKISPDPDEHIEMLHAFELWKNVVEVYSRTLLTQDYDKLIALGGIAKMMSGMVQDDYIAGLWRKYLESQLLWRVDLVRKKGIFLFDSKRPSSYRAPTFSWASVDAKGGIIYSEFTDQDLLIRVEDVNLSYRSEKNRFGVVTGGYIILSGVLKKIRMSDSKKNTRYGWELLRNGQTFGRRYTVVYLDCPESNADIFGPDSEVYLLPAAKGDRKDHPKYLICLLLQLFDKESGTFKRIGLTRVSPYLEGQEQVLEPSGDEKTVPCRKYNKDVGEAGEHIICVI